MIRTGPWTIPALPLASEKASRFPSGLWVAVVSVPRPSLLKGTPKRWTLQQHPFPRPLLNYTSVRNKVSRKWTTTRRARENAQALPTHPHVWAVGGKQALAWDQQVNVGPSTIRTTYSQGEDDLPKAVYGQSCPCGHLFQKKTQISFEKPRISNRNGPNLNNPVQFSGRTWLGLVYPSRALLILRFWYYVLGAPLELRIGGETEGGGMSHDCACSISASLESLMGHHDGD